MSTAITLTKYSVNDLDWVFNVLSEITYLKAVGNNSKVTVRRTFAQSSPKAIVSGKSIIIIKALGKKYIKAGQTAAMDAMTTETNNMSLCLWFSPNCPYYLGLFPQSSASQVYFGKLSLTAN